MKKLIGNKKKASIKKVTLYIVPYYNHYYGGHVYLKRPIIDKWGLNDKPEKGYQISLPRLYDFMGIKDDYENYNYKHYEKVFEDLDGGFKGGLVAETIKITGFMPIDKEGEIIFAF